MLEWLLVGLIFVAAVLYSSVGHAGASGYLAAMAICGVSADVMKPAALTLNVFVASITALQFLRAGCFSWRVFWPFAIASVPMAFVGGWINVPGVYYKPAVGVVLLFAAFRLVHSRNHDTFRDASKQMPLLGALFAGAAIGLLSGATGTGGGIFLTPLITLMGWAGARQSAGISAVFILVNSLAGIGGVVARKLPFPATLPYWIVGAVLGGLIGSHFGSRSRSTIGFRRVLALVLMFAASKLILGF
jgi:uncharacterized membrane protein YfcA